MLSLTTLKSNSFFPFSVLGTATNYSLPMGFKVVDNLNDIRGVEENTVYVCINNEKTLSYRFSRKDKDGKPSLSTIGTIYHNEHLSVFERLQKYFESFYRNTRYMGKRPFTEELISTQGSDLQLTILAAANSKHDKDQDMPVSYPYGETHSVLSTTENDEIKRSINTISEAYSRLFRVIDAEFNLDRLRRIEAGMSVPFNVVEGPDGLGYEVGNRVAEGLLKSLAAIAQGQCKLSYKSHSRGACETILITHDIQFVLDGLPKDVSAVNEDSVRKLINEMKCQYTKTSLNTLMDSKKGDAKEDIITIFKTLCEKNINSSQIEIHISLLDPVPGNSPYWVPRGYNGEFVTWNDERMFVIPKIVKKCLWFGYQNEHSECFAPVLPTPADPVNTKFHRLMYPGHHGSASGNPFDQNSVPNNLDPLGEKTKTIQWIHLLNLIDFDDNVPNQHELLEDISVLDQAIIDFKSKNLDQAIIDYKSKNSVVRSKYLLALYEEVQENREYYDYFNSTCYRSILRREGTADVTRASEWWFGRQYRSIFSSQNKLSKKVKSTDFFGAKDKHFVNAQHAALYLSSLVHEHFDYASMSIDVEFINKIYTKLIANDLSETDKSKLRAALSIVCFTATQSYLDHIDNEEYCHAHAQEFIQFLKCVSATSLENSEIKEIFQDQINDRLKVIIDKRLETISKLSSFGKETVESFRNFYNIIFGVFNILDESYKEKLTKIKNSLIIESQKGLSEVLEEEEMIKNGQLTDDLKKIVDLTKTRELKLSITEIKDSFTEMLEKLTEILKKPHVLPAELESRWVLLKDMELSQVNLVENAQELRSDLEGIHSNHTNEIEDNYRLLIETEYLNDVFRTQLECAISITSKLRKQFYEQAKIEVECYESLERGDISNEEELLRTNETESGLKDRNQLETFEELFALERKDRSEVMTEELRQFYEQAKIEVECYESLGRGDISNEEELLRANETEFGLKDRNQLEAFEELSALERLERSEVITEEIRQFYEQAKIEVEHYESLERGDIFDEEDLLRANETESGLEYRNQLEAFEELFVLERKDRSEVITEEFEQFCEQEKIEEEQYESLKRSEISNEEEFLLNSFEELITMERARLLAVIAHHSDPNATMFLSDSDLDEQNDNESEHEVANEAALKSNYNLKKQNDSDYELDSLCSQGSLDFENETLENKSVGLSSTSFNMANKSNDDAYFLNLIQAIKQEVINYQNLVKKQLNQPRCGNIEFFKKHLLATSELINILEDINQAPVECIAQFSRKLELVNNEVDLYKNPEWGYIYKAWVGLLNILARIIPGLSSLIPNAQQEKDELVSIKNSFKFFKVSCEPLISEAEQAEANAGHQSPISQSTVLF